MVGRMAIAEGGCLWRREMRLWDNEVVLGWYAATDGRWVIEAAG
jgi:hypothetical protein